MKKKINIDLPTNDMILVGLTPHEQYPNLLKAEKATADAEAGLERRRAEHAAVSGRIDELPDRILRGDASDGELVKAMQERDASTVMIAACERAAAKAREHLKEERAAAKVAVNKEISRRAEALALVDGEIEEVVDEIETLRLNLYGVSQRLMLTP